MKLLFSLESFLGINGQIYEVEIKSFKTVTHIYYKKAGWAYWSNVIKLKGKDRKKSTYKAIVEDMES